jgi:hypothetical protein
LQRCFELTTHFYRSIVGNEQDSKLGPPFNRGVDHLIVSEVRTLLAIFLIGFLTSSGVEAQAIPGRWEAIDTLPRGSSIIVTLTSVDRAEYIFVQSAPDFLVLTNQDGQEVRLAKADVRTIERQQRDGVRNGALIGAAVGFGGGFLTLAAFNAKKTASGPIWDREDFGYYISAGLIGAGIGALVGTAVDAGRKGTEILYSRR